MTENRYILAQNVGIGKSPDGSDVIVNISAARDIVREPDGTVVFWFSENHTLKFTAGGADKVWELAKERCGIVSSHSVPPIKAGGVRT